MSKRWFCNNDLEDQDWWFIFIWDADTGQGNVITPEGIWCQGVASTKENIQSWLKDRGNKVTDITDLYIDLGF